MIIAVTNNQNTAIRVN